MLTKSEEISNELISYLTNLSIDQWNLKVSDEWTVKDIISHLIGWNIEASKVLPAVWKTKETPWFLNTDDYEKFNRTYVEAHRQDFPQKVLREFIGSEEIFSKVIQEIGEDNLRKQIDKYYWVFDEGEDSHYLEHLNQIKTVVEKY
ncbi:hypothetical protein A2422_01460 [Candidatus Woesebacteria bacterium RIFOXYC1_FULL_31_51]|uniref:Mycothiol-dependent maleylpyruvate isomerase metal-binding domain-containing protein n=1 Tax=Candidatus Woesebacteria bacterium GW2011_GWC2_31_9 TaxID=1618586 RepID=A0A0G0AWI2_9BACT|nr:MAG: hypothetical protein UR17_C0001G0744 [Candidatus Woesebacteria bacterium GW2011_GWF1_31_35]KKP22652.1 MAG: hypothetical protein UR11_C0002G0032 [Candidatus Woesebacteria bacterium GW2011_GWC1_30_29]KKP26916.1 MAG: hypothetical protein UR13_C0001G0011 [Candidatus Woesebacteria bacterium GW2011_GWD1_31_12]KKP27191.1 MAG: hypothetical protein UR16_C0006G0080 [Candidatus Woesebacteria bacterium GW2011_GWB1_31_29]KKP30965.1 MAG: hypothetical protein UR21_C0019G0011 [Candidatus Woesebacteria 